LDLAHTIHVLLVILGETWSGRINPTIDVIVGIFVDNAIETIFCLGDLSRGAPELILVGYVAAYSLWCVSHNVVVTYLSGIT
jgi:hypothetical protein